MEFRDAIKALFGNLKQRVTTHWREIGGYTATFSPYDGQIYANETCRSCIRTLAEQTSKANARATNDKALEDLLNIRPNMYMNGKDFLYKIRTLYEIYNTVFIYINRDDRGVCTGLYPIPQCTSEAVDSGGFLYIRFYLPNGTQLVAAWEDLAVLRKDFNSSDIWGDSNAAIGTSLDLLHTTNQGMANAIKSTANLRGVLKSNIGLKPDDLKARRDLFVKDYAGIDNTSGIGAIDTAFDFTPTNITPTIAHYKHVEELRLNIYRYFGMSEDAIQNKLVGDTADAFYEGKIEPFLIALSLEFTYKIYTPRQRGYKNAIMYESNRMQFMTMANKLALVQLVDRKILTPNEVRFALNLAPYVGGDEFQSWQNPQNITPAKGADANADQNGSGVQGNEPAPSE